MADHEDKDKESRFGLSKVSAKRKGLRKTTSKDVPGTGAAEAAATAVEARDRKNTIAGIRAKKSRGAQLTPAEAKRLRQANQSTDESN